VESSILQGSGGDRRKKYKWDNRNMIIISREAKEYKYQKPKESQTNIKETQVKGYQHH
jgi:hypothetical protein